jgi:hypothetical protein
MPDNCDLRTFCKLASTNSKLRPWKMPFYDSVTSFHCKTHVFILLSKRNKSFLCLYSVASVDRHVFIFGATEHVQSAVHAERILDPLRLVGTARRTPFSFQACMNGCKPACSTNYPFRNGNLWIRKFAYCYWVAYNSNCRLRNVI